MKLVIDISKDIYEHAKEKSEDSNDEWDTMRAIANGTPLPKGHGRIIDADDIALIDEQFYVPSDYYVAESAIDNAPTIIEADKESENK